MELFDKDCFAEEWQDWLRTAELVKKAIPGQVVDADSEANFGVGAFLLAACEYVRYLEAPEKSGSRLLVQSAL